MNFSTVNLNVGVFFLTSSFFKVRKSLARLVATEAKYMAVLVKQEFYEIMLFNLLTVHFQSLID